VTVGGNRSKAGLVVGLGFVALGAIVAYDTAVMRIPPTYAKVGPQVFPYLTAMALALLGAFFIFQGRAGKNEALHADTKETDWTALAAISAGLLSQALLIEFLGFIISAALLFVLVAWGFGSRKIVRDSVIAIVLSGVVYVGFTQFLNLQLPAGIFKGLL